jgi:hypothetical protein
MHPKYIFNFLGFETQAYGLPSQCSSVLQIIPLFVQNQIIIIISVQLLVRL